MENLINALFLNNWQRKLLALITATIVWVFVNQSITDSKTVSNIPARVYNLPPDKTVRGMLPNGFLNKRVTLTLSGTQDVMEELEAGDLEVHIDASTADLSADNNDWIVQIGKKNLVSLNPSVDISKHITQVEHTEFVVKLNAVVSAKIPIHVLRPKGNPPEGYEYLDVWPQTLSQTITGAEDDINELVRDGLEIEFDLNEITKENLDSLRNPQATFNDEVSYSVPQKWKFVTIPLLNNSREELNDNDAQYLHIDFLRKQFLAIDKELPIRVFYPTESSGKINPDTYSLEISNKIQLKDGISILTLPLYLEGVSQLFLKTIKDHMEIAIVAAPVADKQNLQWSVNVIAPYELEDVYVAHFLNDTTTKIGQHLYSKSEEKVLRERFRDYMQRVMLYSAPQKKLKLKCRFDDHKIKVGIY